MCNRSDCSRYRIARKLSLVRSYVEMCLMNDFPAPAIVDKQYTQRKAYDFRSKVGDLKIQLLETIPGIHVTTRTLGHYFQSRIPVPFRWFYVLYTRFREIAIHKIPSFLNLPSVEYGIIGTFTDTH